MITGFNHSGFVVRDLDKMVSFYRDDLGLQIEERSTVEPLKRVTILVSQEPIGL